MNQNDSIINWPKKDSESIHVFVNHADSNQIHLDHSTNIESIHNSDGIREIEKILALPVHSQVHASPLFTYGSIDPSLPLHELLAKKVTPRGNIKPRSNSTNPLQNVPADPDSYPSLSDFLLQSHLTHQTTSVINEENLQKKDKNKLT